MSPLAGIDSCEFSGAPAIRGIVVHSFGLARFARRIVIKLGSAWGKTAQNMEFLVFIIKGASADFYLNTNERKKYLHI